MSNLKTFVVEDNTVSYRSDSLYFETRGNDFGLFQIVGLGEGDSALLQVRISGDFPFETIMEPTASTATRVPMYPEFRVITFNESGSAITAAIHV